MSTKSGKKSSPSVVVESYEEVPLMRERVVTVVEEGEFLELDIVTMARTAYLEKEAKKKSSAKPETDPSSAMAVKFAEDDIKTFEDVLTLIGPFGKWQMYFYFWIYLYTFMTGVINMALVFYIIPNPFVCDLPPSAGYSKLQVEEFSKLLPSQCSIPAASDLANNGELNSTEFYNYLNSLQLNESTACHSFRHFAKDMETTVTTSFDLVCDRKFFIEIAISLGNMCNVIFNAGGHLVSDKFGRKTTWLCCGLLLAAFGLAQTFSPTIVVYAIFRGIAIGGFVLAWMSVFTLASELTTTEYRTWTLGLYWLPYSFGYCVLAAIAFWIKRWRLLNLIIYLPFFGLVVYFWLIPESPRWLLVEGKLAQAEKVLRTAAKMNGRKIPENLDFKKIAANISDEAQRQKAQEVSFFHVFKYRSLTVMTLISFYVWAVKALVYVGVALNMAIFPGNIFVNVAIAAAVELIGAVVLIILLQILDRKYILSLFLALTAINLALVPWIDVFWLKLTLVSVGKLCIYIAANVSWMYTAEIYPTVVRNSAMMANMGVAGIGGIIAPYIAGLGKLGPSYAWLPMSVFAAAALPASALVLLQPRTSDVDLADHLDDADRHARHVR